MRIYEFKKCGATAWKSNGSRYGRTANLAGDVRRTARRSDRQRSGPDRRGRNDRMVFALVFLECANGVRGRADVSILGNFGPSACGARPRVDPIVGVQLRF